MRIEDLIVDEEELEKTKLSFKSLPREPSSPSEYESSPDANRIGLDNYLDFDVDCLDIHVDVPSKRKLMKDHDMTVDEEALEKRNCCLNHCLENHLRQVNMRRLQMQISGLRFSWTYHRLLLVLIIVFILMLIVLIFLSAILITTCLLRFNIHLKYGNVNDFKFMVR
jgi:hypothetical protein